MPLLQFWPTQPHYLLEADGRTLTAGETFEASEKDAEMLLGNPDIRLAESQSATTTVEVTDTGSAAQDEPQDKEQSQPHSPFGAERKP